MKKVILICTLVFMAGRASANMIYKTGAGVRVGPSNGITWKTRLNDVSGIELLLFSRYTGFFLGGLYEFHQSAFGTESVAFYYGVGAHAGVWDGNRRYGPVDWNEISPSVGFDGIIGLEWAIGVIPFAVSLDWKPLVHVYSTTAFWVDEIGFSVRYVIASD